VVLPLNSVVGRLHAVNISEESGAEPDVAQLDALMFNAVWALTVPMQLAVFCNCEILVAAICEVLTLFILWHMPTVGIGKPVLLHSWTAAICALNIWFGYSQSHLKRETFLLLLASSSRIHEDDPSLEEGLHVTFQKRFANLTEADEDDPLVQLPELKWEQYQNQLNEYLNSTTLSFHQPNLNTMYYELHCHQRSREVHCMFLWQVLLCLFLMLAWNLASEPAERVKNPSVNRTLLLGGLTGVIATMTRMLKECSKVKLWFWNVFMISAGLFQCYNILGGVDSVKSNLRNDGADGSLVQWGRVLFGYSTALSLVNSGGCCGL